MSFGEILKEQRKMADLTQVKLAKDSGVSRTYLSDVENDRYQPSVNFIEKVTAGLSKSREFTHEEKNKLYNLLMSEAGYGYKPVDEMNYKIKIMDNHSYFKILIDFGNKDYIEHSFILKYNSEKDKNRAKERWESYEDFLFFYLERTIIEETDNSGLLKSKIENYRDKFHDDFSLFYTTAIFTGLRDLLKHDNYNFKVYNDEAMEFDSVHVKRPQSIIVWYVDNKDFNGSLIELSGHSFF